MFEDRMYVAALLALLGVAAAGIAWLIRTINGRVVIVRARSREEADEALRTAEQPAEAAAERNARTIEEGLLTGGWQVLCPPCRCDHCILFVLPDGREASVRYFLTPGAGLDLGDLPDVLHRASDLMRDQLTQEWIDANPDTDTDPDTDEHAPC